MERSYFVQIVAGCLALWAGVSVAAADQVTITATRDVTLIQDADGSYANGSGQYLFAGRTGQGTGQDIRRALMYFDLTSIPGGSTISSVTLNMTMNRTRSGSMSMSLYRVLESWSEGPSDAGSNEGAGAAVQLGDSTWIHSNYPFAFWTTPGGSFSGSASATAAVSGNATYAWISGAMIADVSGWINNPVNNFGWALIGDETGSGTSKRFDSRTGGSAGTRPRLTVSFTPPAGTIGACCAGQGLCSSMPPALCSSIGGVYQGDSAACTPNPCPQPTGACCLNSGMCVSVTQASCVSQGGTYRGNNTACGADLCPVVLAKFVDPLPIPAVAQPVSGVPGGVASYSIGIRQVMQQLHRDLPPTKVWGYDGAYPGPTIEAATGLPVTVTWINDLKDSGGDFLATHALPVDLCMHGPNTGGAAPRTVVHLHGGHVPAAVDGQPELTQLPGEQATYVYPNNQEPATLWYHDHALGITRLNVMMGLAGFYLIRDGIEASLGLPSGVYEVPLVVQDRSFNADGSLRYQSGWHEHFFGDTILVNGKVWPYLNVSRGKYRFRLLNGSNSRVFTFYLSNGAVFQQISTDAGMLPAPVTVTALTLAPGERADVIIDFAPYGAGTQITLTNAAAAPYPGDTGFVPDVMRFIVGSATGHTASVPSSLRAAPPIPESESIRTRELTLSKVPFGCGGERWTINNLGWDDITEFPRLGTTEIWSFINRSPVIHPMHIHLVRLRVLDRQEFTIVDNAVVPIGPRIPPGPGEAGWKDTVLALPTQITRVIMRFETYQGTFPYHCHVLEHEDHEMMRQFTTVCRADYDADGYVRIADIFKMIEGWFRLQPQADWNHDNFYQTVDIFLYIEAWFGPC